MTETQLRRERMLAAMSNLRAHSSPAERQFIDDMLIEFFEMADALHEICIQVQEINAGQRTMMKRQYGG